MSSRYQILDSKTGEPAPMGEATPIGQGGLGSVYKAYDTQLQRDVAMKRVLTVSQGASQDEVKAAGAKLIAEAQTLSTLNHPNIVTVFDVGSDDEGGFVVMELLKGETLDETVERGVLTTEDFKEVVFQTMEGLIAAQDKNVIHRDIKPTNIMLIWQASGKFQLKILDFGLAKFSHTPSVQTMDQDDAVMGSIFFMAPEQFERAELDARTDLYQMGCVYYHSLTGQYPFNGETAPQVMNAHLQHKVVPLEQLRPDMPPAMTQWVMWLINRDIGSRPAEAKEALKYFPKDATVTPELPVAAVAEPTPTPATASTAVKVVIPGSNAKAPPNLIVGGTTGRLTSGGSGSVAVATGQSGSVPIRVPQPPKKGIGKGTLVTAIVGGAIILIVGTLVFVQKQSAKADNARLEVLYRENAPLGNTKDVAMLVEFMTNDKKGLPAQRTEAYKTLLKIEGSGVDEAILEELKKAESSAGRRQLSTILSARGYKPAMKTIMAYSNSARQEKDKLTYLKAAQPLATSTDIDFFLDGIKNTSSVSLRKVYEDTIVSIIRHSPEAAARPVMSQLRQMTNSTEGGERRSIFRILGMLAGEETEAMLDRIFKSNDKTKKQDAVSAYMAWPNRDPLPKVAQIAQSEDRALSVAAQRAYSTLTSRPGPQEISELIADWEKGFELFTRNPSEMQRMMQRTIEVPHPRTVAMLEKWKEDPKYGRLATAVSDAIKKNLNRMVEIESGKPLKGTMARVQGDDAGANRFLESLTAWTSPDTYFTWNFKIKEAGDYSITVMQADLNDTPSDFIIYLAGQTFKGQSSQTTNLEEFKAVKLPGKVSLRAGQVYQLTLIAGEDFEPRMMDIGSIILTK